MKASPRIVSRNLVLLLIIVSNVACDQVTKKVARQSLDDHSFVEVIGKHFILTKVENTGAFLSLGNELSLPLKFILLNILPLMTLLYGLYYILRHRKLHPLLSIGIAFVVGGGIGNLYDRILYQSVTDFMYMELFFIKTGIFNMADVSIMLGMGLIMLGFYRHDAWMDERSPKAKEIT